MSSIDCTMSAGIVFEESSIRNAAGATPSNALTGLEPMPKVKEASCNVGDDHDGTNVCQIADCVSSRSLPSTPVSGTDR